MDSGYFHFFKAASVELWLSRLLVAPEWDTLESKLTVNGESTTSTTGQKFNFACAVVLLMLRRY